MCEQVEIPDFPAGVRELLRGRLHCGIEIDPHGCFAPFSERHLAPGELRKRTLTFLSLTNLDIWIGVKLNASSKCPTGLMSLAYLVRVNSFFFELLYTCA